MIQHKIKTDVILLLCIDAYLFKFSYSPFGIFLQNIYKTTHIICNNS